MGYIVSQKYFTLCVFSLFGKSVEEQLNAEAAALHWLHMGNNWRLSSYLSVVNQRYWMSVKLSYSTMFVTLVWILFLCQGVFYLLCMTLSRNYTEAAVIIEAFYSLSYLQKLVTVSNKALDFDHSQKVLLSVQLVSDVT